MLRQMFPNYELNYVYKVIAFYKIFSKVTLSRNLKISEILTNKQQMKLT